MSKRPEPFDVNYLREILEYFQETGLFRWRITKRANAKAGMLAAPTSKLRPYTQIGIDKKLYSAHHLAWFYVYGHWPNYPEEEIDHVNLNKRDNRISNLRMATRSLNRGNLRVYQNSKTGIKGIRRRPSGRYEAQIQINKRKICLGTYDSMSEASSAYCAAAIKYFGHFGRGE